MGRNCQVCSHKKRLSIDRELIRGVSVAQISLSYGVTPDSLYSHKSSHLSRQLLKSAEIRQVLNSQALLGEITSLIDKTKAILKKAERRKKGLGLALMAIRELRETYKFMCSLAAYMHDEQKQEPEPDIYHWDNLTVEEMEQFRSLLSKLQEPSKVIDVVGKVRNSRKRFRRRTINAEPDNDAEDKDPKDKEPSIDDLQEKYGGKPRMDDKEYERQERRRARMISGSGPGRSHLPG